MFFEFKQISGDILHNRQARVNGRMESMVSTEMHKMAGPSALLCHPPARYGTPLPSLEWLSKHRSALIPAPEIFVEHHGQQGFTLLPHPKQKHKSLEPPQRNVVFEGGADKSAPEDSSGPAWAKRGANVSIFQKAG